MFPRLPSRKEETAPVLPWGLCKAAFSYKQTVLFGVIFFSCSVTRASAFFCAPLIVWIALIVCDVALVICASSFVQKSLFG